MSRLPILSVLVSSLAALAVACTASAGSEGASDTAAITGSLSDLRGCAVRDRWTEADLTEVTPLNAAQFQTESGESGDPQAKAYGKLDVKGVGTVYVVESESGTTFFANGQTVARYIDTITGPGERWAWFNAASRPLSCPGDPATGEDAGTRSCLDAAPFDFRSAPWNHQFPKIAGACSDAEIDALARYYPAHRAEADIKTGWIASVSEDCARCAFGDVKEQTGYGPILLDGSAFSTLNVGGCFEQVTGSIGCGMTRQQLHTCERHACEACATPSERASCVADAQATVCKDARDAELWACGGSTAVPGLDALCGDGTAFEPVLRASCGP